MKFLQSKLFAAILGAMMFLLTTAFLTTSGLNPVGHAEGTDEEQYVANKGPSWTFFNPELDQIVAELKAERAELDSALGNIKKIQQQVDRDVFRIKQDEVGNLKKLAKMYAAMEPAGAAKILRELDDVIVVKILTLMKEPETAVILESFARLGDAETKRAAGFSESLRSTVSAKTAAK